MQTKSRLHVGILPTRVFQKTMKVAFEKVRKEVANLNSFVQERISGIKIVQIFSREEVEIDNFQKINIRGVESGEEKVSQESKNLF